MTDNALHDEITIEQRHLDVVYARVDELRQAARAAEADSYRIARVGTFAALVDRDAMVFHQARRRYALDAEHEGLVFGRLDLLDGETYYVGRLGIRADNAEPLVIDWRAPAAAAFYRATAADPQGVIRRRMIQSNGGTVTGIEDDLLDPAAAPPDMRIVGDGAMLAALARTTGTGMRDIVATIQREQDEAIRSPAAGVTMVSGGPGTGKTAVALHRAAYLLYSDRARFAGGGVLVVGPSSVFVTYISQVLPSLGEESATLRSLGSIVEDVDAIRSDPSDVAAIKGSLRMRAVLRRAVRDAVPHAPTGFRMLYRGTLLRLTSADLDAVRASAVPKGQRRNEVRRQAASGLVSALRRQAAGLGVAVPESGEDIAERSEFRAFLRAWWPVLTPADVLGWLASPDRLRGYASGILSTVEIALLEGAFDGGLSVADVALLDELGELLGTPPAPPRRKPDDDGDGYRVIGRRASAPPPDRAADHREWAHIVVDEAQDVSPMQWRMLARRGRFASWTVVGDPAQSAWTGDLIELARARDAALAGRRWHAYELSTNYRNSAEIFALAAAVVLRAVPDASLPRAVRSTGVEPEHDVVPAAELPGAVQRAVDEMLAAVAGTVGVIADASLKADVAGWLSTVAGRVQVVSTVEAKGMEYDGVVVVEPGQIGGTPASAAGGAAGSGPRTLYVALTRATQRLTTVGTDPTWLPA